MAKRCPAFYAFNSDAALIAVRCGSWYCPHCMKKNARLWAWRVNIHVHNHGGGAWFWTFTLGRKYRTAAQGFEALPKLWDRLRKYLQRNLPCTWEYCAFVEGQPKRGHMPHFHVISLQKCPKRVKDVAMWNGFGYQADEKHVTSGGAASYVAKYASKQSPVTPKGFRRVRASQGWSKLPQKSQNTIFVQAARESLQSYLERVASETNTPIDTVVGAWLHKETAYDYWERDTK
jgi:hypothetical protein